EFLTRGVETYPGGPIELYGMTVPFSQWPVSAGDHWISFAIERQYEGFPPSLGGPNPTQLPQPPPSKRSFRFLEPPNDATPAQLAEFQEKQKRFQAFLEKQQRELISNTKLNYALIGGPYEQQTAPSPLSRKLLYSCGHLDGQHKPDCARKIIANLVRRAFR